MYFTAFHCRIMKIFDFFFNYRVHLRLVVRYLIKHIYICFILLLYLIQVAVVQN